MYSLGVHLTEEEISYLSRYLNKLKSSRSQHTAGNLSPIQLLFNNTKLTKYKQHEVLVLVSYIGEK